MDERKLMDGKLECVDGMGWKFSELRKKLWRKNFRKKDFPADIFGANRGRYE